MVRAALTTADFAIAFRDPASRGVEYSYDAFGTGSGITVRGEGELISRVRQFVGGIPAMGEWLWTVERFIALVHPTTFLFRIDDGGASITALTIYARFPRDPGPEEFASAMQAVRPFSWRGPPIAAIARTLGCVGPRGIGLRVKPDGAANTSIYFRLDSIRGQLSTETLFELAELCEFPQTAVAELLSDLRPLYTPGQIGVIGLDTRTPTSINTLKFDPSNVPLSLAVACVRKKGASRARTDEIVAIAQGLRSRYASYVGMKYNADGFSGARLYFSVDQSALDMPARITFRADFEASATLRAPHY
jgi:hypothetical protein